MTSMASARALVPSEQQAAGRREHRCRFACDHRYGGFVGGSDASFGHADDPGGVHRLRNLVIMDV